MPADHYVIDSDMKAVADAIRTKGGTTAPLVFPDGFVQAINDIKTGGGGGVTPMIWTRQDFTEDGWRPTIYKIKPELRQYFIVGDVMMFDFPEGVRFTSTPIPGLAFDGDMLSGKITGGTELTDVMDFLGGARDDFLLRTANGSNIPIKSGDTGGGSGGGGFDPGVE